MIRWANLLDVKNLISTVGLRTSSEEEKYTGERERERESSRSRSLSRSLSPSHFLLFFCVFLLLAASAEPNRRYQIFNVEKSPTNHELRRRFFL